MDDQTRQYITDHLKQGINESTLKEHFQNHGWSAQDINKVFDDYTDSQTTSSPSPLSNTQEPSKKNSVQMKALKMTGVHIGIVAALILLVTLMLLSSDKLAIIGIIIGFIGVFLVPIFAILIAKRYRIIQKPVRTVVVTYIGAGIFAGIFSATHPVILFIATIVSIYFAYYLQIGGLEKSLKAK